MTWNPNIGAAPKGRTVTRTVKTDKGERSYEDHEKEYVILATKCGKVTKSYWVPMERRWCMLASGETPVAWQPWPQHPGVAA